MKEEVNTRAVTAQVLPGAVPKPPHTVSRTRQRCSQLFLIYQGRGGKLMMPALKFIQRTQIHDRNLLLFRDNQYTNYQRGVSPQIPSVSDFIEWQRLQCEKFPHANTVYCLGTSAGGYAALVSGYFLKVPIVWSFAPITHITDEDRAPSYDPLSERCTNLKTLLSESNGTTEYRVFYNESCDVDRIAAEHIADCPGVRLFPQPGQGHGVVPTMLHMGHLNGLLPPFAGIT